jgi:hypothetical protein
MTVAAVGAAAFGIGDAFTSGSGGAVGRPGANAQVLSSSGAPGAWARRAHGRGRFGPWRMAALGRFGGLGGLSGPLALGRVTAVGSGSITISTGAGLSRRVKTGNATRYFTMLTKSSSSAVAVGDEVAVLAPVVFRARPDMARLQGPARDHGTALAVVVIEPYALGTVTSTSSGRIVVTGDGGLARDVLVNGSTTYTEAGTSASASAVTKGSEILAYGSAASDPTQLRATNVVVVGPRLAGVVTSVSGSTFDLRTVGGSEAVTTTSSTIFRQAGKAASLADVAKGDVVEVIGQPAGGGTVSASAVRIGPKARFMMPGPGAPWATSMPGGPGSDGLAGLLGSLLG